VGRIRFLNRRPINDGSDCVIWPGALNSKGYPMYRNQYMHRAVYLMVYGHIPIGMQVCHTCDKPACIDATHLWLGTPKQNSEDMVAKGRSSARPCAKCGGIERESKTRNCIPCAKEYRRNWLRAKRARLRNADLGFNDLVVPDEFGWAE
jgi:hypothetical protein